MPRRGYCSIVNGGCLAPAGYRAGGGIAEAPARPVVLCTSCGGEVCKAPSCSTLSGGKRRVCADCIERVKTMPYQTPTLTEFGRITRRTLGGSGAVLESMASQTMRLP